MAWEELAGMMDEDVDSILADTIHYSVNGTIYVDLGGYVLLDTDTLGMQDVDGHLGHRWRVKIRKDLVGTVLPQHRIRHPKLGAGTFAPIDANPDDDGRYFIFDVRKVA